MKKTALITGASSGIGKELARIHAAGGGDLVLSARRANELDKLKNELEAKYGVEVLCIAKDLSERNAPAELWEEIRSRSIEIEFLINNAGFGGYGKFHERDWSADLAMINLNILALTELTRLALPGMVEHRRGRILNIGSTAGFMPGPLQAVYFATKAFVVSFSEAIAHELKGTGVSVTVLCPGPVDTGFIAASDLGGTKLFSKTKTAEYTARRGYEAMMQGKRELITEFRGMIKCLIPILPQTAVLEYTRRLQEKK